METKPEGEREELKQKFGEKVLTKQMRGQRMMMAPRRSSSSRELFTYGQFEEVYPMTFEFVISIGGFSGAPEQAPPDGFEWIKSPRQSLYWEVLKKDLLGNYHSKDATPA
jgi:hypothetical protein